MRLLAALCVFHFTLTILGPASVHAQAPTQLQTLSENLDGVVEDIAGPRTFVDPAISRIWVAKGRVRASLRMSDRVRVHAEDKTFSSGAASAGNPETIVALDFNDANGRLYTLTQAGIYREETAVGGYGQPNPGGMSFLDFSNGSTPLGEHLEPGETFQDVKVWPDSTRVFLLTSHRIIALTDILTLALAAPGTWSQDMFPPNGSFPWITDTTGDAAFNSLKVHKFLRFRLCLETDESPALKDHLIAVVLAETSGYGPAVQRPVPNVVLLCDLGAAAAYEPRFDSDPDAGDVHYAYFHVAPSYPGGASFKSEWFNIYGIDAFQDSNNRGRAYLACGNKRHVQEALIASALPRHDTQVGSLPTQFKHVLPELDHENPEQALNVLADDLNPSARFFVVSQNGFHTHLVQSPGNVFVTDDEPFGKGCSHDLLRTTFVSLPSEIAEPDIVVTATTGVSDYKIKAMNVTEDLTSGIPLASVGGRAYAPFTVDGGVVLPHAYAQAPAQRDDVYIATWGRRGQVQPDDRGRVRFRPCRVPAGAGGRRAANLHTGNGGDRGGRNRAPDGESRRHSDRVGAG